MCSLLLCSIARSTCAFSHFALVGRMPSSDLCGISGAEVRWPAVDLRLRSGRIRQRTLPIGADGALALARLQ